MRNSSHHNIPLTWHIHLELAPTEDIFPSTGIRSNCHGEALEPDERDVDVGLFPVIFLTSEVLYHLLVSKHNANQIGRTRLLQLHLQSAQQVPHELLVPVLETAALVGCNLWVRNVTDGN
jgi:hypothetical protein